jgi:hypothetical protein
MLASRETYEYAPKQLKSLAARFGLAKAQYDLKWQLSHR